ncbi:MAG: efflux RND transporter periplasmic adaptor subunit [Planctomycetales bacterium]|nr:efflux RND transporter periplasmic adaptor subunit [Planctomycetales bacterium]
MSMATTSDRIGRLSEMCLRAALPLAILAAGWVGFENISAPIEREPTETSEKRTLRTRIQELTVTDYPTVVQTHGVVQAHNEVTLTPQISGVVQRISPSFEVGSYFTAGETLVEIDDRNYKNALAMAESRLHGAQSALHLAKLNEQRKLRLIKSNAVAKAEVDAASATREQAEADVSSAEAQVEQAELDLQRTKIVAPFDGRVQAKNVGLGQVASANTPLGRVFAVDFAEVRLPISGSQRKYLRLPEFADDEHVDVVLRDAINDASNAAWHASIVRTEGVLDEDSRDLFAIARIEDPFGRKTGSPPLRIGQPVVASIEGEVLRNVVALPRGAVRQLNQIVLVKREDQTLLPLEVEALWSDARHVVVGGASIPPNMWLATTHMVYAPEGSTVEIIPDIAETAVADSKSGEASGSPAQ